MYFWGKVIKTFSNDIKEEVSEVEIEFLTKKDIGSDPKTWTWIERSHKKDIQTVDAKYIFYGPAEPNITKGKFIFPDEAATSCLNLLRKKIEG